MKGTGLARHKRTGPCAAVTVKTQAKLRAWLLHYHRTCLRGSNLWVCKKEETGFSQNLLSESFAPRWCDTVISDSNRAGSRLHLDSSELQDAGWELLKSVLKMSGERGTKIITSYWDCHLVCMIHIKLTQFLSHNIRFPLQKSWKGFPPPSLTPPPPQEGRLRDREHDGELTWQL